MRIRQRPFREFFLILTQARTFNSTGPMARGISEHRRSPQLTCRRDSFPCPNPSVEAAFSACIAAV